MNAVMIMFLESHIWLNVDIYVLIDGNLGMQERLSSFSNVKV